MTGMLWSVSFVLQWEDVLIACFYSVDLHSETVSRTSLYIVLTVFVALQGYLDQEVKYWVLSIEGKQCFRLKIVYFNNSFEL